MAVALLAGLSLLVAMGSAALAGPGTDPTTEPALEPATAPATEAVTAPTTEPATEAVTEVSTAPATAPETVPEVETETESTVVPAAAPVLAPEDIPRLTAGDFSVRYLRDRNDVPPALDILTHATFELRSVAGGFTGPSPGVRGVKYHFNDPVLHGARLSENAIKYIQEGVRSYVSGRGYIAVFVYAADATARDTANGPDALLASFAIEAAKPKPVDIKMIVVVGIVKRIRAVSSGYLSGFPLGSETQISAERIVPANSPAQPGGMMIQDPLEDYLALINRQPGRHVDISLSSADEISEDDVELDYLIHRSKPWTLYTSAYNTGTRQTNQWQERFGFIDNELTGHDDIFSLDYSTSSFYANYSLTSSYDFPILDSQRVRGRFYGSVGKFTSSDLGLNGEILNGDSWEIGAEASVNVLQVHDVFVDIIGGAKVDNYSIDVTVPPSGGTTSNADAAYLFPYVGARLTKTSDVASTALGFEAIFDTRTPDSPSDATAEKLGRLDVDRNYTILEASASQSFYIEPLFSDWATRDRQARPVAANEMYFSSQGQFSTGDKRLIPELEGTAGGLYSVRGYPQSAVAGDSVIYGTAEYRLHLPRLLGVAAPDTFLGEQIPPPPLMGGGGFNYQPRAADAPGDWDLILKAFVDAGYVHYNQIDLEEAGTSDAGLVGTGVGVELRLRDNVTVSADYGVALTPVHEALHTSAPLDVNPGSGRFNFAFTLLY